MLSGDNSILSQAGRARDISGEKSIAEKVQLAYIAALANGQGEVTEGKLKDELDKEFGQDGYELSEDLTKVIIDEKEYDVGGAVTGGGSGLTQQADGVTYKDNKGNEWIWIEVPNDGTGPTYPANATDSQIEEALRDYCEPVIYKTGSDYKNTTCGWTDEWYAWDTNNVAITESTENLTDAQKALTNGCGLTLSQYNETKHAMLNSIKNNGGFYIGKYETGNEGGTLNKTYYDGDDNVVENPASTSDYDYYIGTWSGGTAVIKQNQFPYNWVTCSQAQNLAKGFATDGKTASLLFGIQWDLVLKFLSVKGEATNLLNDNSTSWGNYSNNNSTNGTFNITSEHAMASSDYGDSYSAITKGTEKSGTKLLTTGASTGLAKQGIYDLAGNVYEWTLEKTSSSDSPCALRGGSYGNGGGSSPASDRLSNYPTLSDYGIGFRVALY